MITRGRKILVVDSDVTSLTSIWTGLAQTGFQVRIAYKPHLEDAVSSFSPDLLLLGSGLCRLEPQAATIRHLRRDFPPHMAVYVHAQPADADVEALVSRCGADGYFRHASSIDSLAQRIESVLAARREES